MIIYLIRRLNLILITLVLLTTLSFSLGHLFPGEPLTNFSGERNISLVNQADLEAKYRINENYWSQYIGYLQRLFDGDWGKSLSQGNDIFEQLLRVFPATLELSLFALFLSLIIGIPLGLMAGLYYRKPLEKIITSLTLLGYSLPIFWLALILIITFALQIPLFPISGQLSLLYEIPNVTGFLLIDILVSDVPYREEAFADALHHLVLPVSILSVLPTAVIIRIMKASVRNVLSKNYIKVARAKGLSNYQILTRHLLRNAIFPVIRQLGLQFSMLITLAMITEVIFSWPGIGGWLIASIYQRDYPSIQGGLLAVSAFVVLAGVFLELLQTIVNPLERKNIYGSH